MNDTGSRFSYSIRGDDFTITDNYHGTAYVYQNGQCLDCSVDTADVISNIRNLVEALSTYPRRVVLFGKKLPPYSNPGTLLITEDSHLTWSISCEDASACYLDNYYISTRDFDTGNILRAINTVYANIVYANKPLEPKRDIVRRISDVGVLVWVYDGHSLVTYERSINGCVMEKCLVDDVFYEQVLVGTSMSQGIATLFTLNLEEILTFPLDDSILAYFPDGDKMFSE